MKPLRFALFGAGGIAQAYAQVFDNNPEMKLVAIVDVRHDAAHALAERAICPAYTSREALLESGPAFDAAIICTPPNTHEEIATELVGRGIHVLCEKPFTLNSDSARRMLEASQKTNVVLTMASKFRYVADVIKAKSIVTSGILGDIILFENAFTSRVDMSQRWNAQPAISGGGVIIDNGTHSVDLMRYFLGPLTQVHTIEGKRVQGLTVEDTARIFTRSSSGVMGSVDLSWSINKELDYYLSIYGSRGTVLIGWKDSKYRQQSSRDWVVFGDGYNKVHAFSAQLTNFTRCITSQEPLIITPQDALASVEVIEAAYRSLRESTWTNV